MMKQLIFVFTLILTQFMLISAQADWESTFGGDEYDQCYAMQRTSDDGYILAGTTFSFGADSGDLYLVRADADGNLIWQMNYDTGGWEIGYDVQQTRDGGYIVTGENDAKVYLVKTNVSGALQWQKTYSVGWGEGWSVKETTDNGYIIVGSYLIKTDGSGNIQWSRAMDSTIYRRAYSVLETSDGYIVAGSTLIKTDFSGNVQWEKPINGLAMSMQRTSDGGYIIGGYNGSLWGGPRPDFYLLKTDSAWNYLWEKTYGGDGYDLGYSVAQTSDNGYIIAGATSSFGSEIYTYVIKTDASGNLLWDKTIGPGDHYHSVVQSSDGGYVISTTTRFGTSLDFYLAKIYNETPQPLNIELLKPSANITLVYGDTVDIEWDGNGPAGASVSLWRDDDNVWGNGSGGEAVITVNRPVNGFYSWSISDNTPPGIYYVGGMIANGLNEVHAYAIGKIRVIKYKPVLLIHGWLAFDPNRTWAALGQVLNSEGIDHYIFPYPPGLGDPTVYAQELKDWIKQLRVSINYHGKFNIVCHSMGAIVSRWYMEKLSGAQDIGQWIGLAPVNNGAAIASFEALTRDVFKTMGWMYYTEAIRHMQIPSDTLAQLNYDENHFNLDKWGTRQSLIPWIKYRNLMGINYKNEKPDYLNPCFFHCLFGGTTWVVKKDSKGRLYSYWTRQGDGMVAMEQNILIGVNVGNEAFEGLNHNKIHDSPEVIAKVLEYLKNPSLPCIDDYPIDDPEDDHENNHILEVVEGLVAVDGFDLINFMIDQSMKKAFVSVTWPGSDLDLTLISPSGIVVQPGASPVLEYSKGENSIWCVIDSPEPGTWTARIDAVDVPAQGEQYNCMIFYSRQLDIQAAITINPDTLNLTDKGKWITCYINLPEGYKPSEINVDTVLLNNTLKVQHSDIQEASLMVKFDRQALVTYLEGTSKDITLTVEGMLADETYFGGSYTIKIIEASKVLPNKGTAPLAQQASFALFQNYPNPFNPETWIPYQLAENVDVTIRIYSASGDLVRTLELGQKSAGFYTTREKAAYWDGKNNVDEPVSSGLYFYTIKAGNFTATRKMTINH